jgi:hypothetical protein
VNIPTYEDIGGPEACLAKAVALWDEITGIHPLLEECFPHPTEAEFQRLVQSLDDQGLRNPIVLNSEGVLLDGRSRLMGLYVLGLDLQYEARSLDPRTQEKVVISANLARQHLTDEQVEDIEPRLEALADWNDGYFIERPMFDALQAMGAIPADETFPEEAAS